MSEAHPKPGERYRHQKGGTYHVDKIGKHSETGEILVVYTSESNGETWIRPLNMWLEPREGRPRFERIDDAGAEGPGS